MESSERKPDLDSKPDGSSVFVQHRRTRLALGSSPRRLSFERRVRFWLVLFSAPTVILSFLLTCRLLGLLAAIAVGVLVLILVSFLASVFYAQLLRPLQTLANIVVALRENDFTLRARGGRRGDALGDLAMEINLLAGTLQQQRSQARDAVSLAERVIAAMPSPVLAFDGTGTLRFHNQAAQRLLHLPGKGTSAHTAQHSELLALLNVPDGGIFASAVNTAENRPEIREGATTRWSVRRTSFRLEGVPHALLVLSDIAAALREEERLAWQRLIRVLGHEINNSLAPISSIAGSLRARLPTATDALEADLSRGLGIIEDRAGTLHRFLIAYQRLSRLPTPTLQVVQLQPLLERVTQLETRAPVKVHTTEDCTLLADPDQLQQLFINLVRNAVDAAVQQNGNAQARVDLSWRATPTEVVIRIRDNGPGIANPRNLFVPFYTTKPQGSGIGLVLAQQIASAHRGTVTLTSRHDAQGCDAEIYLPRHGAGSEARHSG